MYQISIKNYLEKHGFEALRPKAVLFDMDGVLYDSMPRHAIAWQQSMAKFGIGRKIDEAEAQLMYDEKTRIFHEQTEAPIMAGIPELMQKLSEEGIQCCVVTGSGQRPLINRILSDFGAYVDESRITTAYDVKQGKPHPDPYLMGLQKAGGLKPWEAVVVENAPLGIMAGVAAKIFTIAVNTGPLPDQALLDAGADLLFPSMAELCESWETIIR